MSPSKTKKKIALIKTVCHALELVPTYKNNEKLSSIYETIENAKTNLDENQITESRVYCDKSLAQIRELINTLTPTKLRKALDRQLDKIDKY